MSKIDIFYPFDKGFFGKTLMTPIKDGLKVAREGSKIQLDSIDDLNHYFSQKLMKSNLERVPAKEEFTRSADIEQLSDRMDADVLFHY